MRMMLINEMTMVAVLVPAMLLACWCDYRAHRVPNWLNGALAVTGLAVHAAWGGWNGLAHSATGLIAGLAPLLVLWMMRGMGAGDVKFMAALGAWLGPTLTLYALAAGGLAGGVMAVAMIAHRGAWRTTTTNLGVLMMKVGSWRTAMSEFASVHEMGRSNGVLPYAIPLSVGTFLVLICDLRGWWGVS